MSLNARDDSSLTNDSSPAILQWHSNPKLIHHFLTQCECTVPCIGAELRYGSHSDLRKGQSLPRKIPSPSRHHTLTRSLPTPSHPMKDLLYAFPETFQKRQTLTFAIVLGPADIMPALRGAPLMCHYGLQFIFTSSVFTRI